MQRHALRTARIMIDLAVDEAEQLV